ncbi:hypothetical protein YC2023_090713 [Brassica napus]
MDAQSRKVVGLGDAPRRIGCNCDGRFWKQKKEREAMGLVSRIFSGIVVFRSSGSVSGKKKLLQFFFAGFLFFREAVVFAFSGLFRLCPIKTFCTSLAQLTLESRSCDSIDVDLIPLVPSGEGG